MTVRGVMFLAAAAAAVSMGDVVRVTPHLDAKGHAVPKTLYGIFFEDINYAADGGIYPELLANRGFDWQTQDLEGWERDARGGGMARLTRQNGSPVHEATATHLRIEVFGAGEGTGVRNRGYHGIYVEAGKKYDLSFYARALDGYAGDVRAVLEDRDGKIVCEYRVRNGELNVGPKRKGALFELPAWKRYTATFAPARTVNGATFSILLDKAGVLELEQVSLFPQDTFNGHKNGLRKDLVQLLKEMKPGIVRFPGGCLTEGRDWPLWYDWKLSVGDGSLESRSCIWNTWGYWQTMGLGYYEYFRLCEDLGAEPLPVMAGGLTCQFARPWDLAPMDSMDYFIQNFCDLIEFANGDPEKTVWGALRAKMGHPKPFNLKYLGIGNENWGKEFLDRYEVIAKEVRKRHPEIRLVSSAGAAPNGGDFELAWNRLTTEVADVVDEHYYVSPEWLLGANGRYDKYDRSGKKPKVYAGEYACHTQDRVNSLYAALCEAAMMTGFERNSDVVEMTSYAPLFCKVGGTQWKTDLIWFDNARSFGTPSYYVQKMYATNLPTKQIPSEAACTAQPVSLKGNIALQTWNTTAEFKDIKVTDASGKVLFEGLPDLRASKRSRDGKWSIDGGVLRQSAEEVTDTTLRFGNPEWRDYTVTLKAKKLSGKEGFIIWALADGGRHVHANLGGWVNREHGFEAYGYGRSEFPHVRGAIETGKWYDIELSVRGNRVTTTVDGAKVLDATLDPKPRTDFFQTCGIDEAAGEVIVKCVNTAETGRDLEVALGKAFPAGKVKVQTLTGTPGMVNDLDHPKRCATVESERDFAGGATFKAPIPANSFTVFRLKM